MNSVTIEKQAINYLEESLLETEFLCPYISSNDREPLWDGHIYLYGKKDYNNNSFIGRVPTQVKGKLYKELSSCEIKYKVAVTDLRSFYKDGGVIFFVVAIKKETRKIYYATLSPTALILLLKECNKQKTKTITLKEFPLENKAKIKVLMDFYENRKKQQGFDEKSMLQIDDVKSKKLETFMLESAFKGNSRDFLSRNEVYLYAKEKNTDIYIPILADKTAISLKQKHPCEIRIKDRIYYKEFQRIKYGNKIYLCFGGINFQISQLVSGKFNIVGSINFKPSKKLNQFICDLTFLIEAIKNEGFVLNETKVPFSKKSCNSIKLNELEEQLLFFTQIKSVFEKLHIKKELNVRELTSTNIQQLNWLIGSFFYNKNITNIKPNMPLIGFINIQDIHILCALLKKGENEYRFYDLFNLNEEELETDIERNKFCEEVQALFSIEDYQNIYLAADNIDYKNIILTFERLKGNIGLGKDEVVCLANTAVLQLLFAHDITKNQDQLKAAEELNQWIIQQKDKTMRIISKLNNLQIVKRRREFTEEEISCLYGVIERAKSDKSLLVAAYLLLDNQDMAQKHFQTMKESEKKEFTSYPIFHFAKFEYNARLKQYKEEREKLLGEI